MLYRLKIYFIISSLRLYVYGDRLDSPYSTFTFGVCVLVYVKGEKAKAFVYNLSNISNRKFSDGRVRAVKIIIPLKYTIITGLGISSVAVPLNVYFSTSTLIFNTLNVYTYTWYIVRPVN